MSIATTHKNYSHDWYTPGPWMEWVYKTLGTTAVFDPCPEWWNEKDLPSGLDTPWTFPAYINHPGSRGSTAKWWAKAHSERLAANDWTDMIWCAFSVEQLRHMDPSPFFMDGWLIMPHKRIKFINGSTGEVAGSPANWTVFWSSKKPAATPEGALIVRTHS
jgi:hypothetical protein